MKPASPVYESAKELWGVAEVVYAKDQPQYLPLPALRFLDGVVVTRWVLSWKERLRVLLTGSVYLSQLTFNSPLQPVKLSTDPLEACGVTDKQVLGEMTGQSL